MRPITHAELKKLAETTLAILPAARANTMGAAFGNEPDITASLETANRILERVPLAEKNT